MKKRIFAVIALAVLSVSLTGCFGAGSTSAVEKEQVSQNKVQEESNMQVPMPAVTNFQEKKLLKEIYERRDQVNMATFTYTINHMTGKPVFLGKSLGYGVPASMQFNNPKQVRQFGSNGSGVAVDGAEPNGLYSPGAADGTWVMMINPEDNKPYVVYCEEKILVSPFPLKNAEK